MTDEKRKPVRRLMYGTVRRLIRALVYGLVGGLLVLVIVFVVYLEQRPDLKIWHTAHLDAEFTVRSAVTSFDEYLVLEDRLFAQLDKRVYAAVAPADKFEVNRYNPGSLSDPGRWPTDWNRSFELPIADPRAGVLLLHGMSDSPYSLGSIGRRLHAAGAHVVALRVPGHGTAPSGLVKVRWEDMAAAVELAMRHLHEQAGDRPLYIVGYSNGGALAVHYALATLEDTALPAPRGLVLISPEIGVTRLAALAVWQERLGRLLGLRKLAWSSISPEYDPFKYGSFAINAGNQAYRLTTEIQTLITNLESSGDLARFPAVLAFQSVVDATVSAPALVHNLFERLPPGEHELVLFDINRFAEIEPLLKSDPREKIDRLFSDADLPFAVTLVTNKTAQSREVVARRRFPGKEAIRVSPLGLAWPNGLYSLSHLALPFPADDPLYGGDDADESPGIQLGNVVLRGERGVLQVTASDILRLRWNPFYPCVEQRLLEFIRLDGATHGERR